MDAPTVPQSSLGDVMSEYNQWRSQGNSGTLQQFAVDQDTQEGSTRRKSAYNAGMLHLLNAYVGKAFSSLAKMPVVGTSPDFPSLNDIDPEIAQQQVHKFLAGETPESSAAGLAGQFTIAAGAPSLAPTIQSTVEGMPRMTARALFPGVGMYDAAIDRFLTAKETGSSNLSAGTQGVLAGATFGAFPALQKLGTGVTAQLLSKAPEVAPIVEKTLETAGGTGLAMAGMQIGSSAEGLVQKIDEGKSLPQAAREVSEEAYTPQNLVGQAVGMLPFAPMIARGVMEKPQVSVVDRTSGVVTTTDAPTLTQAYRLSDAAQAENNRQQFTQAMMQSQTAADAFAQDHPEVTRRWSDYRKAYDANPDDPKLPEMMNGINDATKRAKEQFSGDFSNQTPAIRTDPKYSLISPTGELDFNGTRPVTGSEAVDAVLENRLVPTGVQGNEQAVQLVEQLKNGLMPAGGRNFDREAQLLRTGLIVKKTQEQHAALSQNAEPGAPVPAVADLLDDRTAVTWKRMNSRDQSTALLLADIYMDPRKALHIDDQTWYNPPVSQIDALRTRTEVGARSVIESHSAPIGTPEQLGHLVGDANQYVDQVNELVKSLNLPPDTLVQLQHNGPLTRFSEDELSGIYAEESMLASMTPQGESVSRVIENVKSRVLAAKMMADRALDEATKYAGANRPEMADFQADAQFRPKLEGLPQWTQDVVGSFYGKANAYSLDRNNNRVSRLNSFRDEVGQALDSISPEDRARLAAVPTPEGFSIDTMRGLLKTPNVERSPKDLADLRAATSAMDQLQPVMESTRVTTKDGQSNLWDVLNKEHKLARVEGTSEAQEPRLVEEPATEGNVTMPTDEEGPEVPTGEGAQADVYKENQRGYNDQIAQAIVEKHFNARGPAFDPQERLNQMSDVELQSAYAEVFGARAFAAKTRTLLKTGYGVDAPDGTTAATSFIRDFLNAELADPGRAGEQKQITDAKKAVLEKYYQMPYEQLYKKGVRDWPTMRDKVTSAEGASSARLAMLKGILSGYDLKPGTDLQKVGAEIDAAVKAQKPQGRQILNPVTPPQTAQFDMTKALTQAALQRGLSQQWVDASIPTMARVIEPFSQIRQQFMTLENPRAAFDQASQVMRVLGLSMPDETLIGGQHVKSPIIAMDFNEILDRFKGPEVGRYMITVTGAHENLHNFVEQVVKHPEKPWPFHVKAQVQQYLSLLNRVQQWTPEDRSFILQSTVDAMLPTAKTRDVLPNGLTRLAPEWQSYIDLASKNPEEFAAVLYSHAVAGMAREAMETPDAAKAAENVQERMRWLDDDVREFARGQFRDLSDFTAVIQKTLDDPLYRIQQGYQSVAGAATDQNAQTVAPAVEAAQGIARAGLAPGEIGHYEVLRKVARLDMTLAKMQASLTAMGRDPSALMDEAAQPGGLKVVDLGGLDKEVHLSALALGVKPVDQRQTTGMLQTAADWASGKLYSTDERFRQSAAMRNLSLMPQRLHALARQGLPVADDASVTLNNWTSTMHMLRRQALQAFTPQNVTLDQAKSQFNFMFGRPETAREVQMRKAFSDITGAVQKEGKGVYSDQLADPFLRGMDPTAQATVKDCVQKQFAAMKNYGAQQLAENENTHSTHLGWLAMQMNPGKLTAQDAAGFGRQMMQYSRLAEAATDPTAPATVKIQEQQAMQSLQMFMAQKGLRPETLSSTFDLATDAVVQLKQQADHFAALGDFATEQRYGRYAVTWTDRNAVAEAAQTQTGLPGVGADATPPQPKTSFMAFPDELSARHFAKERTDAGDIGAKSIDTKDWTDEMRLAQNMYSESSLASEMQRSFNGVLAKVSKISTPDNPALGQQLAEMFQQEFDPLKSLTRTMTTDALKANQIHRNFSPGREHIDYAQNFLNYGTITTSALAKQNARSALRLQTLEMRQKGLGQLANDVMSTFVESTTPELPSTRITRALISGSQLAGNIPNAILEGIGPVQNGVWALARDVGTKEAVLGYGRAAKTIAHYSFEGGDQRLEADAARAEQRQVQGYQLTKEEEIAKIYKRMRDGGLFEGMQLTDDFDGATHNVNYARPEIGELEWKDKAAVIADGALNMTLNAAKFLSYLRSFSTAKTRHVDAISAVEAGYSKGLRGDALDTYARAMLPVQSLIGNRAIRPMVMNRVTSMNPVMRNLFGSMYVMMNYEVGFAAQMYHDMGSSFSFQKLPPGERSKAMQAFGGAALTMIALAGVNGLPGVQSLFALTQKATGVDPEKKLREAFAGGAEGLGHLLGSDDASGKRWADILMSGAGNELTGVDIASRAGGGSPFGFSDQGWSATDLSPTIGRLSDAFSAVPLLAQGQYTRAAMKVMPGGVFKAGARMVSSLYNYGDVRTVDSNDNLVSKPENVMQLASTLAGMGGSKAAKMNRELELVRRSEDFAQKQQMFDQEGYARQMLKGDSSDLLGMLYQRQFDTDFDSKGYLSAVVDRALNMQSPRDAMDQGALANSRERQALGATFDTPRRSAVQRLQAREELMAQLGYPMGTQPAKLNDWTKASLIDQLEETRGVTRQEALQIVQKQFGL